MDCIGHEWYVEKLKTKLTMIRFEHSLRVAEEARRLSARYHEDEEKAYLAGLLHDYARDFPQEALRAFLPSFVEREAYAIPAIWHALAAHLLLRRDLGVCDYRVLHAVCWHATSCESMSLFDKIVFVADIAEEGRGFSQAIHIRRLAWDDLEKGYELALQVKMGYLLSTRRLIYPASIRAWNQIIGVKP